MTFYIETRIRELFFGNLKMTKYRSFLWFFNSEFDFGTEYEIIGKEKKEKSIKKGKKEKRKKFLRLFSNKQNKINKSVFDITNNDNEYKRLFPWSLDDLTSWLSQQLKINLERWLWKS